MNSGQSVGKEEGHWAGPTSAPLGQHYSGSDAHSAVVKLLLLCPRHSFAFSTTCFFFFQLAYESTACGCALISLLTFRCTHVYIETQYKALWLGMNAPDYPEMCDFGMYVLKRGLFCVCVYMCMCVLV